MYRKWLAELRAHLNWTDQDPNHIGFYAGQEVKSINLSEDHQTVIILFGETELSSPAFLDIDLTAHRIRKTLLQHAAKLAKCSPPTTPNIKFERTYARSTSAWF